MTISMFQASVPVFLRMFGNLSAILDKAAAQVASESGNVDDLLQQRLHADMLPLLRQIQIATDNAKGPAARLAGITPPAFEDNETSFADAQARITKTIEFLKTLSADQIDGSENRAINLKVGAHDLSFQGLDYLLHFALPNFYFHINMVYAILRHHGIVIGKLDYLGGLPDRS